MSCSLHDLEGRHELAALVVERMPAGFNAANHPVFVIGGKRVQYLSKFEAPLLLRLDGDLYLHSCPPWIAKESSHQRRGQSSPVRTMLVASDERLVRVTLHHKNVTAFERQINDLCQA
jgi:hypothetical protein